MNGVPVRLKLLHRRDLVPCCLIDIRLLQACGNALFQNGVARQTFGFSGYVVSDCDSIADAWQPQDHDFAANVSTATALGLKAGCDLDCGLS